MAKGWKRVMTNGDLNGFETRETRNRKARAFNRLMAKVSEKEDLITLKKEGDFFADKKAIQDADLKLGFKAKRLKSKRLIRKAKALLKEDTKKEKDNG